MKQTPPAHKILKIQVAPKGAALVIVLGVLVLLLAIVVGFLSRVAVERSAAASYSHAAAAARLAETSVQLVQAQIEYASSRGNGSLWVSQPGMVRTYSGINGNSTLDTAFKLYSAKEMTSTNATTLLAEDKPPNNPVGAWTNSPAEWVDLNAPVVSDTNRYFPILNPDAINHVPGFSVNASWVTPTTLPMPVRWLYVLAGGEIIAPSSSNGMEVSFSGSGAVPTATNPIIGRIAFWTDDESAKVNVNTAGAPTFFDLPWYATDQEKQLADSQPARREFQRYPGHPATVDLTAVLTPLLTDKGLTKRQIQDETLDLAPRLDAGGSYYATKSVTAKQITPINITSQRLYASENEILYDPDRVANSHLTNSDVDLLKFFLTAHSRAPELNPFNLPKVAMWPLHSTNNATYRTSYEYLINRAASINDKPYYFQRANSRSPTADWVDIPRNQELFAYLNSLLSQPLPGLGLSLKSKFQEDQPQILGEILDYIRSTNLYDDLIPEANRFTRKTSKTLGPDRGHGFVAPLQVKPADGKTYQGFGRFYTLSELAFLFICNADGYDRNTDGINDDNSVNNGTDTDFDVADPQVYPWVGGATSDAYNNYERRRSRYGRGYAGVRDPTDAPLNFNVPIGTMLPADRRIVQMMVLPELFSPMYGYGILRPDMRIEILGLSSMTLNGQPLFPHASEIVEVTASYQALEKCWPLGGAGDFRQALVYTDASNNHSVKGLPARGGIVADAAAASVETTYPLVSDPVTITVGSPPPANATMSFVTGCLTVKISYGSGNNATLVQTIHLPAKSANIPVPNLVAFPDIKSETETATWWGFHLDGVANNGAKDVPGRLAYTSDNVDSPGRAGMLVRGTSSLQKLGLPIYTNEHKSVINTDVVRSFVPKHGDFRLVAAQPEVASDVFVPLGDWSSGNFAQSTLHMADWTASRVASAVDNLGKYRAAVVNYGGKNKTSTAIGTTNPDFPLEASTDPDRNPNVSGDYDKGVSYGLDGSYSNKPDEGNIYGSPGDIPYFFNTRPEYHEFDGTRFFSPNRVIPSPGMFGSLPTHVLRGSPWRTLLFRPQQNHPNWSDPKDHLLMEFFWMPVVEPYAISEPFSTAGKINMNYQIMPFTWITRSTGLHAALSEERVTAVPTEDAPYYNSIMNFNPLATSQFRLRIDADKTLEQFTDIFNTGNVFRSASEICDLYLVPEGETLAGMPAFWTNHALTSDNVRERVYTTLYPKLTVRSNIYTVHYKVQALRKRPGSSAATWTEGADQVVGEYRGSTTIERFLDPNNKSIPDYASSAAPYNETPASEFYHWRTVRNVPFAP